VGEIGEQRGEWPAEAQPVAGAEDHRARQRDAGAEEERGAAAPQRQQHQHRGARQDQGLEAHHQGQSEQQAGGEGVAARPRTGRVAVADEGARRRPAAAAGTPPR
jgi:hypothetical protein